MENSTIEKLDMDNCCGCGSCMQKCPKNAITMKENDEGFLYPVIDKEKCINCGLCEKVCPQLNKIQEIGKDYPKAYAMRNKNTDELMKSSSGGIFSVIANYVIDKSGIVFGAAYNENLEVNHIGVESKEDLELLRKSKYVQSNTNNTYKKVEEELKKDRLVLYSGTPCQIFGLKKFLVNEYENLITCDLVCHGVPSPKLFKKYLEYLSEKFKARIVEYDFRGKEKMGWGAYGKCKTAKEKIQFLDLNSDRYYYNFVKNNISRLSCYTCLYANSNRVSDITLADYWGIDKRHPNFYSRQGNSLILVNTMKGENIIKEVSSEIEYMKTDLDLASKENKNLIEPSKKPDVREYIYKDIDNLKAKKYIKKNLKVKYTLKKIIKKMIPQKIKKIIKKIF